MKKNLLKSILALLLVTSLFALASCTGLSKVVDQIQDTVENAGESNNENEGGNGNENTGENNNENGNENGNENEGGNENETAEGYAVTFVTDAHCTVIPMAETSAPEGSTLISLVSVDKETGEPTKSGEGQVNFVVVFEAGYVIDTISIDNREGYNNLKGPTDTGVENGYRITKISADLTVTVTAKAEEAAEDLSNGYQVTFVVDGHATVTAFKTQDMTTGGEENATVAYSRDKATGALTKTDGQVNFLIVLEDGYEIDTVSAEGGYKNLKGEEDTGLATGYRLTKITGEVTVTITTKSATAAAEE